jgi:tRNA A-37 threonylcarbamoyl transferase component Bud32
MSGLPREPTLPETLPLTPSEVSPESAPLQASKPPAAADPKPAVTGGVAAAGGSGGLEDDSRREERLADLLAELTDALQRRQVVDIEVYCRELPELSQELRQLWAAALVTDAVGEMASELAEEEWLAVCETDSGTWQMSLPVRLGDFELLEEVGRGGMGVVFRARQISLNREVAVKMILRQRLASAEDRQRFFAEAEATARLDHPGIVPVYQVGQIDGLPYFSMQYIRGCTLADKIRQGPLPQREAARIVADVCEALAFAHQAGVLHRDIKPSNILIDEFDRVRLTDFGLAKCAESTESLTRSGAILGTPTYMSPEQATGRSEALGQTSDIYSVGSVLYHALTGRPPLVGNSPMELVLKIVEQDPPPVRLLEPRVDRDLEMIVTRCLQKPADLRYPTADQLRSDLEAFLRDEPVTARSGRFSQIAARLFRDTHHAPILENWGLLWMWHALVLLIACVLTELIRWSGTQQRLPYAALWTVGLGAWAVVFWVLRQRLGPVTFVERQIAHLWGASMLAIAALFPMEWWLGLDPLSLSPLLGVISGMVFLIKASMLSGAFYLQATSLLLCSVVMAWVPWLAHLIFGVVVAGCFFVPGLKYYRRRQASGEARGGTGGKGHQPSPAGRSG